MTRSNIAVLAVAATCGSAFAADEVSSTAPYNALYGYIDIHGGHDTARTSGTYDNGPIWEMGTDNRDGYVIGGAARLAARMSPTISVQGDVWINSWHYIGAWTDTCCGGGENPYSGTSNYPGIGGHVTWRGDNGMMFGALASYGADQTYGQDVNLGLEGVFETDRWRFYAQAGRVFGVGGDAGTENDRAWYFGGMATYYFTPDLAVSGGVLGYTASYDGIWPGDYSGVNWGARVDFKPESSPVTFYAAYHGWHWRGSDNYPSNWKGTEHAVVSGVRIPLNGMSVQQTNHEVGLFDMNPFFGDDL